MESRIRKSIAICFVILLVTAPVSTVAAYPASNPAVGDQTSVPESYFDSKHPSSSNGAQTSVSDNNGTKGANGENSTKGGKGKKGNKDGKGKKGGESEKGGQGKNQKGGGAGEGRGQQGESGQAKPKNETNGKAKNGRNGNGPNSSRVGAQPAKWRVLLGTDWPGQGTGPSFGNRSTAAGRQDRSVFNESINLGPDATALDHRQAAVALLERAASKPGATNLDRYVRTLNESFEYVLDADRVDNHTVFVRDKQIVAPLHERAPNVTRHLVSADRLQAEQAIDDAEQVEQVLQTRNVSYEQTTVEKELRLARQAFERAEQQRNGSVASAISSYRTAWIHAQRAIDHMDWATTPTVTIDTRRDIPFEENATYQVNGTVFDVRPYELRTLTLTHGNDTRTLELPAETRPAAVLTFNTSVVLQKPVNQITINSTDPNRALAPTDEVSPPVTGNDTLWLDSDGLPDEYELSVTGTNPRRWDSDSNHTLSDEAGDDVSDGAEDYDGDGVATYNEWVYDLDPFANDTDGDDLTDQFELRTPGLNPSATDSDGDGTPDSDEDPDGDGLTNLREQELGTVPVAPDTDRDGLNESAEVESHDTNPLQPDTDVDGLLDGEELSLGTDPLVNDTDGDGILDGEETYTTTATNESVGASVAMTGEGNATSGVSLANESTQGLEDTPVANATASNVVDLEASETFERAELSISYEPENESNESALAVYRLEPELQELTELNSTVDPRNESVSAEVDRPATYLVMDSQQWDRAFERDLPTRKNANTTHLNESFENVSDWECEGECVAGDGRVAIGQGAGEVSSLSDHLPDDPACPFSDDCESTTTTTTTTTDSSTPPEDDYGTEKPIPRSTFERGITLGDDVIRAGVFVQVRGETSADGSASITIEGESGTAEVFSLGSGETQNWTSASTRLGQFAGENITLHVETEGEETFLELSTIYLRVTRDSDEDGLPNSMELHGIRNYKGEVVQTSPFDADTDGDGISDDGEVGVYLPGYRKSGYHFLHSDPTSADTDGDGLGDYEETHEDYEIVYTDNPDATRSFFGALQTDEQDPGNYLTSRTPGSSAMQSDSDDDGLSDREEVLLGTDAKERDTDGDRIPDGEEDALGGDPTLFDAQPPRVEVWYANFHKPAWSLETTYTVSFTASDASGVDRVALVKNEKTRFEDYPGGYPNSISYGNVRFKTGAGETILDGLLGATVQVEAEDRHGNERSMTGLERTNLYGHVAGELGSDTIYGMAIAHDLGKLSGFTVGAGETIESVQTLIEDPVAFVESLTQIVELLDQLGLLDDLIAMMPAQIDRKQEVTNPYDQESQPDLYQSYRVGWYGGYASYFIVSIVAGAQFTKAIKGTKSFAKLIDTLDSDGKLTDAVQYYQKAKGTATAPVRKTGYLLVKGGEKVAKPVVRGARTAGRAYRRHHLYRRVTGGDLCSASIDDCGVDLSHLSDEDRTALGHLSDRYKKGDRYEALVKSLDESEREALARFVRETDEGSDLVASIDSDAAIKLIKFDVGEAGEMRKKLASYVADGEIASAEAEQFAKDIYALQTVEGLSDGPVKKVARAGQASDIEGAVLEARVAAELDIKSIREMSVKLGPKGVHGELDIVMKNGDVYEVRNVDYSSVEGGPKYHKFRDNLDTKLERIDEHMGLDGRTIIYKVDEAPREGSQMRVLVNSFEEEYAEKGINVNIEFEEV